jgi:hypothetical protein
MQVYRWDDDDLYSPSTHFVCRAYTVAGMVVTTLYVQKVSHGNRNCSTVTYVQYVYTGIYII